MRMSVHIPQQTPYQDVNVALNLVLSNMQAILGDQLIGLYLGGSLALGDFNPHRSDIDFTAVTVDELPPETIVALEEMHTPPLGHGYKMGHEARWELCSPAGAPPLDLG